MGAHYIRKIDVAHTTKIIAPKAKMNEFDMVKQPQKRTCVSESEKKYQGDTFIIMPKESQCGSIKCEFRRNCKNGILLVFIDAESMAVRDEVMDPVSLDPQCAHLVLC